MSADDKPEPRPWLAAARERCNMSQEGLAHRLNVSAKTVGNWELGIYLPGSTSGPSWPKRSGSPTALSPTSPPKPG